MSNLDEILQSVSDITSAPSLADFKLAINAYLKQLVKSPVRSLADVIQFNKRFAKKEMLVEYGQDRFVAAEATKGIGSTEKKALDKLAEWSREGFEKVMKENKLDAIVAAGTDLSVLLQLGGSPGITVPAGYDNEGVPFGITFGGLFGTDPKLIEMSYAFEQATKIRRLPAYS